MTKFLKAFASFSFFTFISRICGVIRDIIIAKKLGAGEVSDIFFIALKFPNFFRRIFAEGALTQAFIPIYSSLETSEKSKATHFAENILLWLVISISLLTIIVEIFTPEIMHFFAPGFAEDPLKMTKIVNATRITFPYLFLIAIVSFYSGILYVHNSFAPGAIMPIIFNLGIVSALSFFISDNKSALITLSYSVLITGFIQLILIFIFLTYKKLIIFPKRRSNLKRERNDFYKRLIPAAFAASIVQLNSWIDTIFASYIPNSVSYLYYTDRLVQLPIALIGTALSIVLLPEISKSVQKKLDKKNLKTTEDAMIMALFLGLPAATSLYLFATEILQTLFMRGEFTMIEVIACMKALKIISFALPAYILIKIIMPHFHARGDMKTPMLISLISVLLNVVLNFYLMRIYSYIGIVLATVISSWLNYLALYLIAKSRSYIILTRKLYLTLSKTLIALLTMAFIAYIISNYYAVEFLRGGSSAVIALAILISCALITYFSISYFLLRKELKSYFSLIKSKK